MMQSSYDHTLSLSLAYKGQAFSGFARQQDAFTVQGNLEEALRTLCKREVSTVCAGRTDAGVHAREQVVSFDVSSDELDMLHSTRGLRSLNALTHEDIMIRSSCEQAYGFSARFDAKSRKYRYFICEDITPPLFMRDFAWHYGAPLQLDAMNEAAVCLLGEHDFKSFCKSVSAIDKPTARNVISLSFAREEILGDSLVVMDVEASSFLHSMVRTLVGTLVEVGVGHQEASWVGNVLAAKDRSAAGQCAPASGLVLWQVVY